MANALYPKFKQNLLEGDIDFDTGTITAYLVDTADYTYSAAHELVTDLTGGAGVVASQTTAMTSLTDGTLDVADFTFSAVTGDVAEAIVIGVSFKKACTQNNFSQVWEAVTILVRGPYRRS